jgi:hypothetical protein
MHLIPLYFPGNEAFHAPIFPTDRHAFNEEKGIENLLLFELALATNAAVLALPELPVGHGSATVPKYPQPR